MAYIQDDFLLHSDTSRRLYHQFAANQPILDYHSHLSAKEIAEDRRFASLTEIWLEGDHYKWRAMRANGVAEKYCTGAASPYEKFLAWAKTVPYTLRNPLYHWTHLELKRYCAIDDLLNEETARAVWNQANAVLQEPSFSVRGILRKFDVRALCTTDDPSDDLAHHERIAKAGQACRVYPTFRPDRALVVQSPEVFNGWVQQLSAAADVEINDFRSFREALKRRHDAFHGMGGRLSDHGLVRCYALPCTEKEAAAIFDRARKGQAASPVEHDKFASFMMLFFGELDFARGWTKQLHLGALRDANSRRWRELGSNTGFDSIGQFQQAEALCAYLDQLVQRNSLPKVVVYNVNPSENYAIATAIGNFQDGSIAGKIQFGSGWWFLDQKEGIEWQLNALSNTGLLSRFIGMLTDSRSFMSFPRHEYFRRILCDMIGREMESGELPRDEQLLGGMIRRICYANAQEYLGLETGSV